MKNFLLGALVFALLSFTAVKTELLTVKPATPKVTVVKMVDNYEAEEYVRNYIKKGYVVKSCSMTADRNGGMNFIIMEKY